MHSKVLRPGIVFFSSSIVFFISSFVLILHYACTTRYTMTIDEGDGDDKDELLITVFRASKVQHFCVGHVFPRNHVVKLE